jgi:transcription initiation factor IIE alpha subunit
MIICENGHDEIVHIQGRRECPLCAAIAELREAKDKISELESDIEKLNNEDHPNGPEN